VDIFVTDEELKALRGNHEPHTLFDEAYHRIRRFSPLTVMYYDAWVERLLGELPSTKGVLLELMCGGGEVSRRLGTRFSEVFAVDLDMPALEGLARDQLERRVRPACANAACLPFPNGAVDAVAIIGGLHHSRPMLPSVLAEIARVLRPGGALVASEPANDHWLTRSIRHWQYRRSAIQGHDEGEDGFTANELRVAMDEAGLRLEEYQLFGFVAYPLMGNADLLPLLAASRSLWLGRALLSLDRALEHAPLIRNLAWASLFRAVKPARK
jgi:SAM-dependent methyltransferase